MKTAILGGGLTGLTLAVLLQQHGTYAEVLEKEQECGGLMRTLHENGFTFDYGGSHILFSKNKKPLNFLLSLLGDNVVERKRNTKVLYKDRYVKYPFENGLSDLPKQENFECLIAFIENMLAKQQSTVAKPKNLFDWFYYTFGKGIASKYLVPYNKKIWKHPLKDMTMEWVERVPNPPVEDIVKSSLGIETEGYKHQSTFYYPQDGGIEAVIKALQQKVNRTVVAGFEVKKVRREGKSWVISDGKEERLYDNVVSTIPIQDLIAALDAPKEVSNAVGDLEYNSLISVMLGLDVKKVNDYSWLYLPDKASLSHRVSFPSNYSERVAPKGKSAVLAEVTCKQRSEIWKMTDEQIMQRVVEDLNFLKIIDRNQVTFAAVKRSKYAYVITDMKYDENLETVRTYVRNEGVALLGRFSEYKYLNMDACVEHAFKYVEK